MLMLPVRGAFTGFGSATNSTSLLPPLPLEEICSQAVLLLCPLQPHTPGATTDAVPVAPLYGTVPTGETSCQVHVVPAWVIETSFPAMFNGGLVVRDAADPAFDVSVRLTVPLPEPVGGDTAAHETGLDAVHEQLVPLAFT